MTDKPASFFKQSAMAKPVLKPVLEIFHTAKAARCRQGRASRSCPATSASTSRSMAGGGLEGLRSKAKAVGQSMIRLALDWAIHQPGITSVLIGARSTSHLDQALDAAAADIA